MKNLLKGENLYPYKGATYGGGGSGNNNRGGNNGGYDGKYGGGGGNGPRKSSGENPEKSSPRRKGGLPLKLLTQKKAQIGVISAPLHTLPAQKKQQNIKRRAVCPLPKDGDRARTGREAGPKKKDRRGVL